MKGFPHGNGIEGLPSGLVLLFAAYMASTKRVTLAVRSAKAHSCPDH